MKLHVTPTAPPGELAELFERKSLQVIDLWADPSRRVLWRPDRSGQALAEARPQPEAANAGASTGEQLQLPEHGYASPMGYWLASPALPSTLSPGGLTITFTSPGDEIAPAPASLARSPGGGCSRPVQNVRVKSPNSGDGDVMITIGPGGARITSTPGAWKVLAEPVVLGICQYWRFAAIDAELARLTEQAHGDLDHSNMPGLATLRARRRVVKSARDARALLLDMPYFQGPLSDPFPYITSERSAAIYESLAEKLRLEEWSELLDDRAEAVEDAYEALTEKLFEFKNFAWEAVLEALIIVILLAELSLGLYEAFAP
jgi:hypothetical protein